MKFTTRKQRWIGQFKPDSLAGQPLNPSAAAAARYERRLRKMIDHMTLETLREVTELFDSQPAKVYFAQDASLSSQARILTNKLKDKFDGLFGYSAKALAEDTARAANQSSESALKASMKQLSGGLSLNTDFLTAELGEIMTATIAENVALIKSIPAQYFTDIQGAVMRSITTGNGLADLVPFIKKHKGVTDRRAHLIANDQTRKAFSNINRSRLQNMGVSKFKWLHSSGGQTPRKLHEQLNGHIFSFNDLPIIDKKTGERGIPGQLINCRCRMIPVIDFNDED